MDLYTQWGVEITRHRWHIAWEKQVIRGEGRTKEGRYCQSQRTEGTDGGMTWNKIRALGQGMKGKMSGCKKLFISCGLG